jgi:hypothetical protein
MLCIEKCYKQATILITNKTLGNGPGVVAQEHSKIQIFENVSLNGSL